MNLFSRRSFFQSSLKTVGAVSATLIAGKTIAKVCDVPTGEEPLGPFFPRARTPVIDIDEDGNPRTPPHLSNDNDLTFVKGNKGTAEGQVVYVIGKVIDKDCKTVPNASIVIWQASNTGRYNHKSDGENHDFEHPKTGETVKRILDKNFQYWGRALSDKDGNYTFKTIVPGFYPADLNAGWYRPPHIHFLISATGFPQLVTQMYFKGEKIENNEFVQELNGLDNILQSETHTKEQREGLVVDFQPDTSGTMSDGLVGVFDITLIR